MHYDAYYALETGYVKEVIASKCTIMHLSDGNNMH